MKNRKGFTFVELLSVMTLIAILGLIAFPSVSSLLKKATNNKYESFLNNVYMATEAYIQDHIENYPQLKDGGTAYVYIGSLVANNYLKSSLTNPKYCDENNKCSSKRISNCHGGVCTVDDYTIEVKKSEVGTYEYTLKNGLLKYNTIGEVAKSLTYDNDTCKTSNNYMSGCYLTGDQTTNYIYFNDILWRIMGVNSDNTVRLISNSIISDSVIYNDISAWYDKYYLDLKNPKSMISRTDYCQDSSSTSSATTTTCESVISSTVYSLSINEYNLAGSNSYLNNSSSFFSSTSVSDSNIWRINPSSITSVAKTTTSGVRPIISVSPQSTIIKGTGTVADPYYLGIDETSNMDGTIGETCTVE